MDSALSERLFISLALPEPCRDALAATYQRIEGISWSRPEQLHLTMRFLGEVEPELAERIESALARVQVEPFLLPLEGTGVFPPRGQPKVIWAGIGRANTRLFQLRQQIDDAVLAAGWRGDMRSFNPHITLGRVHAVEARDLERWLHRNSTFVGPPFRVDAFHLMASELRATGAVHTVKRTYSLARAPITPARD